MYGACVMHDHISLSVCVCVFTLCACFSKLLVFPVIKFVYFLKSSLCSGLFP